MPSTDTSTHLPATDDRRGGSAPPPPPPSTPGGDGWPPSGVAPAPTPKRPGRWRERLPELVGGIGVGLVVLAVGGLVATSWEQVGDLTRAMLLGLGATGLHAGAAWVDGRDGPLGERLRALRSVIGLVFLSATVMVAASVTLALATTFPDTGRVAIGLGGAAAIAHSLLVWRSRRDQLAPQVALFVAAVYAGGPWGQQVADTFRDLDLADAWVPVEGAFLPDVTSDMFLLTAVAHLVVAVAWVAVHRVTTGSAQRLAGVLTVLAASSAALQANVHPSAVGAVVALGIVIATFVYAVQAEEGVLVVGSSVAMFLTGVRVLAAVFSGKVVATIVVLLLGLALLAWALHQASRRAVRATETS